jgi:hypothetical protein
MSRSYNLFQVLERSYPRDPPHIEPPPYNKEMVYENNHHIFEVVDDDAIRVSAEESYLSYTSLVRLETHLIMSFCCALIFN